MTTETLKNGAVNKRIFRPSAKTHAKAQAYYDSARTCYWIEDCHGGWVSLNESGVKRFARSRGISAKVPKGQMISPLDLWLLEIQTVENVAYAGPLAGYQTGVFDVMGSRILVTHAPKLIEPCSGSWDTIKALLCGLFIEEGIDQTPYFLGWIKTAVETLRAKELRYGQALAIAGPHGCGKSLLQKLITVLLGGRVAKPYQFMCGLSPFNGHLFGAEHLTIEDEAASSDIRTRRKLGAELKQIAANHDQSCHAKNRQALTLTPFWRLTITVNDEPENLMVLPPIDDSMEDKLILLRAHREPMPMPTGTDGERAAFWQTLVGELPAFVDFLLRWDIPLNLRDERYGIGHYQHHDLLQAIDDLAPERRLLDLIDAELFSGPLADPWEGKAEQLERRLTGSESSITHEARRVLSYNTACGVYLARLAKKHPARIHKRVLDGSAIWTIEPVKGSGG